MAILIPSKNIYDKDNAKKLDNIIDNVSVEFTEISPKNEYDIAVSNHSVEVSGLTYEEDSNSDLRTYTDPATAFAYIQLTAWYFTTNIQVATNKNNKVISAILPKNIGYRVIGDVTKGECQGTRNINTNDVFIYSENPTYTEIDVEYSIPELKVNYTVEYQGDVAAEANIDMPNLTNIGTADVDISYNNYTFYINNLKLLVGSTKYTLGNLEYVEANQLTYVSGTYEEFYPKIVEITVNGDTVGISLEDGSITYGEGLKPHLLSRNELLQDTATTNGVPTTEYLAKRVLEQYANGKETATILCSIGNYFNYLTKEKEISIDNDDLPMVFNIKDEVVPMVFGVDGKDKPMSLYKDGTPKVFNVVGTNIIYDGALWQEITLQEKLQ